MHAQVRNPDLRENVVVRAGVYLRIASPNSIAAEQNELLVCSELESHLRLGLGFGLEFGSGHICTHAQIHAHARARARAHTHTHTRRSGIATTPNFLKGKSPKERAT